MQVMYKVVLVMVYSSIFVNRKLTINDFTSNNYRLVHFFFKSFSKTSFFQKLNFSKKSINLFYFVIKMPADENALSATNKAFKKSKICGHLF
jgi:hypothetical protein